MEQETTSAENQANLPSLMPEDLARQIVKQSIHRYFEARRERLPSFIDRHFSIEGAWHLNKRAFGRDLYRAPLNVALVGPAIGLKAAARGLNKIGKPKLAEALKSRRLYFETDVARELEWQVYTDLLQIPHTQKGRHSTHDALAEEIFNHGAFSKALELAVQNAVNATGARNREQLQGLLSSYMETRAANAEVVNLAICLVAGAALAHQVTPGVLTLGPTMAKVVANKAAAASFPLGASLGSAWVGAFPVAPSAALALSTTGGILAMAALITAFSGIVSDPVQRALGLHQRRLDHFLDTLEDNMLYDEVLRLKLHDHYVGRIIDLFDALTAIMAYAR